MDRLTYLTRIVFAKLDTLEVIPGKISVVFEHGREGERGLTIHHKFRIEP